MGIVLCEKHGRQGIALLTRNALGIVHAAPGSLDARAIHSVSLAFEELECPGHFVAEADLAELERLGGFWVEADVCRFQQEEGVDQALGMFTGICARCLAEACS
jgi:hypothetical protein